MIRISNILSKVAHVVPIDYRLKLVIQYHCKIFLRNQEILQKYVVVTFISILYATVGPLFLQFHDTSTLLSNMSMGISVFIFANIKLEYILYRASLFNHYGMSRLEERITMDISGLLLTLFFGCSALAYQSLILSASAENFLKGILLLIVFHYVGLYFNVSETHLTKRKKNITIAKYFLIIVVITSLLNRFDIWLVVFVSIIFITLTSYSLHTKRNNKTYVT